MERLVKQLLLHVGGQASTPTSQLTPPLRLNLGCGERVLPGWVNIDSSMLAWILCQPPAVGRALAWAPVAAVRAKAAQAAALRHRGHWLHRELRAGLPLPDGCAEYVYASHVLEHFTRRDGLRVLCEARRCLRPRGLMRVCVPDLEVFVARYRDGDAWPLLRTLYSDLRGVDEYSDRHRFMYDFTLLREVLEEAGFVEVRRLERGEGRVPGCVELDSQEAVTLFVEAERS